MRSPAVAVQFAPPARTVWLQDLRRAPRAPLAAQALQGPPRAHAMLAMLRLALAARWLAHVRGQMQNMRSAAFALVLTFTLSRSRIAEIRPFAVCSAGTFSASGATSCSCMLWAMFRLPLSLVNPADRASPRF